MTTDASVYAAMERLTLALIRVDLEIADAFYGGGLSNLPALRHNPMD
jgi:hypothetical protein